MFPTTSPIKPRIQENTNCSIDHLPKEILIYILISLSLEDIEQALCVCKKWRILRFDETFLKAFSFKKLFLPYLTIADDSLWIKYPCLGLVTTDIPPLDQCYNKWQLIHDLNKLISSAKIMGCASWTIYTIPKGFTLKKAKTIAQEEKIELIYPKCIDKMKKEGFGEIAVAETYRVILSNQILQTSALPLDIKKKLPPEEQIQFLSTIRCETPGLLEGTISRLVNWTINWRHSFPRYGMLCIEKFSIHSKKLQKFYIGRLWKDHSIRISQHKNFAEDSTAGVYTYAMQKI